MQRILVSSRVLLGALLLGWLLLGAQVPRSQAQSDCDQPVIDAAGVFGDQLDEVQAAADTLIADGALLRVRTIGSYAPAASLDAYAEQLEQRCSGWRTAEGRRQPNLLVLLLARQERGTGIYYGTQWKPALDSRWSSIQAEAMNPRFRTGDFAGGFVAGLRALDDALAAPAGSTPATAPAADGIGLGYCVGVLALIGGLLGGGFGWRRRRKAQQLLQAAQQRAGEAKRSLVTLIVALPEQFEELQLRVNLLANQVAPEDAAPLKLLLAQVQQTHEQALLAYDAIKEHDPEQATAKLTVAQYDELTQRYQEVLPLAQRATAIADEVLRQVERIDQIIQQLPQTLSQTEAGLEQARAQVAAVAAQGFKVDAQQALLAEAAAALAEAEQAHPQRRFIQASERAGQAITLITSAVDQARALPKTSQQLARDLERLTERSAAARTLIASGQQTLSAISSAYNPASWSAVIANGSEAEQLYPASQQAIAAARAAAKMERQEWQQARAQVTQADEQLERIETLINAIIALKARLEAAQADAPGLIAAAHEERSAIERELRQYSADVPEQVWADLRAAASELASAEAALRQPQPDYPQVVERAEHARSTAQAARAAAQAAHQAAEEQRQRVAAALRNAADQIDAADRYIDRTRGSDISSAARHDLREARQYLEQAERSADLALRLEYAEKARSQAQDAYSRAQRDVAEAEEERRAAAAAVAMAAASASRHHDRSSDHDSGSSSGSGGSSSSWGSSGGSSSSWGSSGGSSSSWSDSGGGSSSSSSSDGGGGSSSW